MTNNLAPVSPRISILTEADRGTDTLLLAAWQMNSVSRSRLVTLSSTMVFTTRVSSLQAEKYCLRQMADITTTRGL